ncbi:hypothetical protein N7449_003142 [Penicillium cf. viridicatum]|uniref:Uncharacterized protein n=1 Tax=Penicillium cf. viridicatum TaxID=2972119 RepID=A0A9W9MWU0_9EURO|nr:hypothetical protein N7449_003142 [Penicillium cf. viridicatum]
MPQTHAAAGKRPEVEDDPSGDNEPKLTSSKRQKRGKYVSKACVMAHSLVHHARLVDGIAASEPLICAADPLELR